MQILSDSFDSLFTSTILFEQQSLAELITALGQLTVGVLEGSAKKRVPDSVGAMQGGIKAASSKPQPNEGEVLANINTFAISRLVETALVNISRIEVVWKILVSPQL